MGNASVIADRIIQSGNSHNLPPVGQIVPREKFTAGDVAKAQAKVLSFRYGRLKSPAKQQAIETGQSERTCRNQQTGLCSMRLHEFFNNCRDIPELRAWGAMMLGLEVSDPGKFQQELARGTREIVIRVEAGGAVVQQPPERDTQTIDLFTRRRA